MSTNSFTITTQGCVSDKLREARKGSGLSTREVAKELEGGFPISHATIANYEKGRSQPTLPVLAALAELYGRPINWFLTRGPMLTGIRYRSQSSKLKVSEKHRYEADALRWLEGYKQFEEHVGRPLVPKFPFPTAGKDVNPAKFAASIREQLGIGARAPIPSVIDCLESYGIRVIELATTARIDGIAAMLGNEPVVVLNPDRANDRMRINASHEFFHIPLGHCNSSAGALVEAEKKAAEEIAFDCARLFLLPNSELEEAFRGESFVKLVKFKEKFGISVAAMIYAAQQNGILSEKKARFLWIEISRRGWRENEPGSVPADRATRFEQLVDGEILQEKLTLSQSAKIIGVRDAELQERLLIAQGIYETPENQKPLGQEGDDPNFYGLRLAK